MRDELLLLGDSVTVGTGFSGVDDESCYVALLKTELRCAGARMNIRSSALDGADTGYALRRFDRMVARLSPDVIVISLGLNDARPPGTRSRNSPAGYAGNLERLNGEIARNRCSTDSVYASSPPGRFRRRTASLEDDAPLCGSRSWCRRKYNLPLIELFDEFVSRQDLDSLLPDRLHPGRAGHELIARQFARTLVPFCTGRELEGLPSRRSQNFEFLTTD